MIEPKVKTTRKDNQISKLMTDYINDDLKGIINDEIQTHGYKYKKINIYNKKIQVPLQKIWIRIPKVKVFKPVFTSNNKQKKSLQLTTILGPKIGKVKKFYFFVKRLEKIVKMLIKKINGCNKNLQVKSAIRSVDNFDPVMNLRLPCKNTDSNCHEFLFHIYNHLNKRVNLDVINSGVYASAYIELSEVWLGENEFGFNWNVLQLKLYPNFDFNACLFIDEVIDDKSDDDTNECYHCLYCPNVHVRTHMCNQQIFSAAEKNKIEHETQIHINYSQIDKILPPPPPPHILSKRTQLPNHQFANKNNNQSSPMVFSPSVKDLLGVKLRPINKVEDCPTDIIKKNNLCNDKTESIKNINKNMKIVLAEIELQMISNGNRIQTEKNYKAIMDELIQSVKH
jgi:hypothetical protein